MRLASPCAASSNARVTKTELRAEMRARLRDFPLRVAASEAICSAIRRHQAWSAAGTVCAFFPLPSEPQIASLWETDPARTLCVPRIRDGGVDLIRIDDPTLRRRATWRLDTPEFADAPLVSPAEVDLFLVPGLAFTTRGARLGRGGGYYDRLLARRAPGSLAVGVCFALQVVEALPGEEHDHDVDVVISESGLLTGPGC